MYRNDEFCLNTVRSFLTEEDKKEYRKQYFELNRNRILNHRKEYREDKKELLKEYRKTYYETNKEQIKERVKQKITCGCGSVVTCSNKALHQKTKKHNSWLNDTVQMAETI